MKRAELIEGIIAKAELSGAGFEKGLQAGFRSLLNNKPRLRGFSDEDKAVMKRIVKGGTAKQLMEFVGKFSFSSGPLRGAVGTAAGAAVAGPAGAVAAPEIAQGARMAGSAAAARQAELARALAASGGRGAQTVIRRPIAPPIAGALLPNTQDAPLDIQNMYNPRTGRGAI